MMLSIDADTWKFIGALAIELFFVALAGIGIGLAFVLMT
jgi:hypothetical protein